MGAHDTYDDLTWGLIASALEGELSPEEGILFQQWLDSSAANRENYNRVVQLWKEGVASYAVCAEEDESRAWEALKITLGRTEREEGKVVRAAFGKRVVWTAAAVVLLAAGAGWWYFSEERSDSLYQTTTAERNISLPDGSTIVLQPHTRIQLSPGYNATGRTITLISGKASFAVSHQVQRPFMVDMDAASVKDIGTSFTIEKTKDSIQVSVSAGKIAFIQKKTGESREISAGGSICLYTGALHSGDIRESGSALGGDSLRFDNVPLSEVLTALEKRFGKKILLHDSQIAQKRLTVHLRGESFENALQVICDSFDLAYSIKDGAYVLEKRKDSGPH